MSDLRTIDLSRVLSRVPKDIRALMQEKRVFLGGGFIRAVIAGEQPSDIDLFGATKEELMLEAAKLAGERRGRVHETPNALTVLAAPRMPVQFVTRWLYSDPAAIVASFDFTIARAVIWFERVEGGKGEWRSIIDENFYADLAARRLVYCAPKRNEDAGGSLMRVRKFLTRGYTIQAPALGAVVARLAMGVKDLGRAQADGEESLARLLTALIREVDPLTVIDGLELGEEVHE